MLTIRLHSKHQIAQMCFSPGSDLLAVSQWPLEGTVLSASTGEELCKVGIQSVSGPFPFWDSSASATICIYNQHLGLQRVDAQTGKVARVLAETRGLGFALFSPDGVRVLSIEDFVTARNVLSGHTLEGDRLKKTWTYHSRQAAAVDRVTPRGFLPGGNRFIAAKRYRRTNSEAMLIGDWSDPNAATEQPIQSKYLHYLACASVGSHIAFGSGYGPSFFVFDLNETGHAPRRITSSTKRHVTGVSFHPSGQYLAAVSQDGTVSFYDTATWKVAKTFDWKIGKLRCVAFSPDGALAAVGSDKGQVVVWDVDV